MKHFKLLTFVLALLLSSCVSSEEGMSYQSVEDIHTARIGLILGTTHDTFATASFKDAQIIRMESEPDMFIAIQKDKCDVIFADFTSFVYAQREYPNLVEIESDFPADFYGMGFNKSDTALRDSFNIFLKEIKENGIYEKTADPR